MANPAKLAVLLILTLLSSSTALYSQTDPRSDSTDILNYSIHLDVRNFGAKRISGTTGIYFRAKSVISTIRLDLLKLPVSNVAARGQSLSFSYDDTLLRIILPQAMNGGDTMTIFVSYAGTPRNESFGGFYFSGQYAYNLGVGFQADPHCFGRAWFPCYDNFTEHSTYDFHILTDTTRNALCNGIFQGSVKTDSGTFWHWIMSEPIPTYLASVAVAPYHWIKSQAGVFPVILACLPADTAKMKASFDKLPLCLTAYEKCYGPHTFSRIGFNAVPFNGGAMEHATNIAYPNFAIDGTTAYETLWAHEFAHHWWGNTVTCLTQADMWINEGWASYSEKIFLEHIYGKQRYKEEVSSVHKYVLHYAHVNDLAPLPVSGVSHANVYGTHVYRKGSDVAHTLRGYMGDSAFFAAIRDLMVQKKFSNISSAQFRDFLQPYTNADLTAFFDNWVFEKGFPHVSVFSKEISKAGAGWQTKLRMRQVPRFTPKMYKNLPLELSFYKKNLERQVFKVLVSAADSEWVFQTDFFPEMIVLDADEKISDAVTDKSIVIKDTVSYTFGDALMSVKVKQVRDSALMRVEHHWLGADGGFNYIPGLKLNNYRHWTVDGTFDSSLKANAVITYNGTRVLPDGYLDHTLIRITEDSLVLCWRRDAQAAWEIYPDYIKTMGSKTDKKGSIQINNLRKGEYAIGMFDHTMKLGSIEQGGSLGLHPNPADGIVKATLPALTENSEMKFFDMQGRALDAMTRNLVPGLAGLTFDTSGLVSGAYIVRVISRRGEVLGTEKLVVCR